MMIAYASRTGTKRNLAALKLAGWRLMVSAMGVVRTEGFLYALDNGAWTAFQRQLPFNTEAFLEAYRKLGKGADFVVLPDIVAGGVRSLGYSIEWHKRLGDDGCCHYLAVQDGMEPVYISRTIAWNPRIKGIFVGGTTEFKERTLPQWGEVCRKKAIKLHVGRVNSVRRIHLCEAAGADSFDGSGVSRYAVTLPRLENARQQRGLPWFS